MGFFMMWFLVFLLIVVTVVGYSVWKELKKSGGYENYKRMYHPDKVKDNKPTSKNIVGFKVFGDDSYNFDIVGEGNYQGYLKKIAGPKTEIRKEHDCIAFIQPEPDNAYDSNAVAVFIDNKPVGYFDRETAKKFQKFLQAKNFGSNTVFAVNALIVGGWKDDVSTGHYGVKLDAPVDFSQWGLESIED